ncbi:hypothetical protein HI914_00214 [Erysiphe necator]|nr:hypothetical protein HI914_00214 [Erysiphe necator]
MIPGLIDHLNGAATILINPNSIRRSDKDSSISDADIKIACLSDSREIYNDSIKLRVISDIFDITTQKSAPIYSKVNQLLDLNDQHRNMDNDLIIRFWSSFYSKVYRTNLTPRVI